MHLPALLALPLLLAISGLAIAQQPLNVNLLQNPDFETGVGGWTMTRGTFAIKPYGTAVAPPLTVATTINGGANFLECTFAYQACQACERYGILEQTISVAGNSSAIDSGSMFIEMIGCFGGAQSVNARTTLRATFINATGGAVTTPFVDPTIPVVTQTTRNNDPTLFTRSGVYPVPPQTRTLKIEVLAYGGLIFDGATNAWADNLSVKLQINPTSTALPLSVNLLNGSSFEGPHIFDPNVDNGLHVRRGYFTRKLYGSTQSPTISTSQSFSGGSQLLECSYAYQPCNGCERYGIIGRTIDVSGNSQAIDNGSVYIELSGAFGGLAGVNARCFMRASFYNSTGGPLSIPFVDPTTDVVDATNRNGESTVLMVSGAFAIPPFTRRIEIDVYAYGGLNFDGPTNAWADNLSARLILASGRYTPQTGANLIDNGTFELGTILNPAAPRGWRVTRGTFQAQPYGLPNLPTPAVASAIGGGTYLGRATAVTSGLAAMTQTFELNNLETMVDTSQLSVNLEAHLGGVGSAADNCYIKAFYYSQFGAQLGQDQIGPVTAVQRNNVTTLLLRQGTFLLPVGTRKLIVEANFAGTNALLDNLRATLVPSGVALLFPGTGDDLTLGSGINGLPSGGPGRDIKFALPNDVLTLQVRSPQGAFHWMPLILAGNAYGTGSGVPAFGLPSLHVNPFVAGGFLLLDGATPAGPFSPSRVLPPGTDIQLAVPPGLSGYRARLQAIVLSATAGNGLYATTDAHEIHFQ
jgi:hypothetical protein